jgi:hypothetical protein
MVLYRYRSKIPFSTWPNSNKAQFLHHSPLCSVFPPDWPTAAVIELKLCKLLLVRFDELPPLGVLVALGFASTLSDKLSGASASESVEAVDFALKFKPPQSPVKSVAWLDDFPANTFSISIEFVRSGLGLFYSPDPLFPDVDMLYSPFDVMVGGSLITSTRSL